MLNIDSKVLIDRNSYEILLKGDLDISSAEKFKSEVKELLKSEVRDVYLNCKDLDYIDSTGIGSIISILNVVREKNKNIFILNSSNSMKKLMKISGLDKVIEVK